VTIVPPVSLVNIANVFTSGTIVPLVLFEGEHLKIDPGIAI